MQYNQDAYREETKDQMAAFGWADVANDLLFLLAERVVGVTTFIRFSGVCKSWHLVASATKCFKPVPWLMLIEANNSNFRDFYDHSIGEVYRFLLPQAQNVKNLGFAHGWLITCGKDINFNLLNPASGIQIALPPPAALMDYLDFSYTPIEVRDVLTVKATCSSIGPDGECVVALTYKGHNDYHFSFCRPMDKEWISFPRLGPNEVAFVGGIFYTVTNFGEICFLDLSSEPKLTKIADLPSEVIHDNESVECSSYIVECAGEILVAVKMYCVHYPDLDLESDFPYLEKFRVFKLDVEGRNVVEVKSIGDYALFLGTNNSYCLSTASYGKFFKRNCIYFTEFIVEDKKEATECVNIFYMEGGSITSHLVGLSKSIYSFPLWVMLDPLTHPEESHSTLQRSLSHA